MKYTDPHDRYSVLKDQQHRDISIRTMKSARLFFVAAFIVLTGVIVYYTSIVLKILAIPIGIVLWSAVFVFCLHGLVDALEKRGVRRIVGTSLAFLLLFVVLGLCILLIFSPLFGVSTQFETLIQSVPSYINQVRDWSNNLYNTYQDLFQDETVREYMNAAFASMTRFATSFASESAQGVVGFGSGVANTLLVVGFALVVSFWILLELPAIGKEISRLAGSAYKEDVLMFEITLTRVMGGYIKATIIQCAIIGVACGIGFAIMGIPNAVALGLITGLMNLIPIVGPWFGGVLAAVVGVFVSPVIALVALVFTIIIQQLVYTFISPKLMSNSVDIHPALVIIALMVGSAVGYAMNGFFGSFLGMLVSIPLAAAAKSIFVYYFEKRKGRSILSPDGVFFKGEPTHSAHGSVNPLADATGGIPRIDAKHSDS